MKLVNFLATLTSVVRDSRITPDRVLIVFEVVMGDQILEYQATDINHAPGQVRVRLRRIAK